MPENEKYISSDQASNSRANSRAFAIAVNHRALDAGLFHLRNRVRGRIARVDDQRQVQAQRQRGLRRERMRAVSAFVSPSCPDSDGNSPGRSLRYPPLCPGCPGQTLPALRVILCRITAANPGSPMGEIRPCTRCRRPSCGPTSSDSWLVCRSVPMCTERATPALRIFSRNSALRCARPRQYP